MNTAGGFGGQTQSYGAGMAGQSFDPVSFVKRPTVILRAVSLLFAIIVLGCISSGGWYHPSPGVTACKFGDSSGACGFGTAVGVLAMIAAAALLALEAKFEQISSVQQRKQAVMIDLGASGAAAAIYFLAFCVLANQWGKASDKVTDKNNPQAAIAFSFFSIITWGVLAFFGWRRFQEGQQGSFAAQDTFGGPPQGPPYSGYVPGGGAPGATYQEPPFAPQDASLGIAPEQYQQPTY